MPNKQTICQDIRDMLNSGQLRAGMKIPSHRELSRKYCVAIATVTRAINELKSEGVVESVRGVGTTIAVPAPAAVPPERPDVALLNAGNDSNNHILTYAVNEIFIGSPWKVVNYNACANLKWYANFLRECHNCAHAGMILPVISPNVFAYTPDMLPPPNSKVVLLGGELPGCNFDVVRSNPFGEGLLIGDYLVSRAFRSVLYITPSPEGEQPESETLRGLALVLNRNQLAFDSTRIRRYRDEYSYGAAPDPIRAAVEFTVALAEREPMPDVIVAGHDWVAIGVIRALRQCGFRVPEDVSVISAEKGCGHELNFVTQKLTTFDNLYYHQARVAAELLMERLKGNDSPIQHHQIHGMMIPGETSR